MLIDMHLHEKLFSQDSFITVEQIVKVAKMKKLDAVCITDHDNMGLSFKVDYYVKKLNFPIFMGIEFFSQDGDITAFAPELEKYYPHKRISSKDFTELVDKLGGFSISCHPYRNNNRGLGDKILDLPLLGGVEVLNGSTDENANLKALQIAKDTYKKRFGVSDAHVEENIGKYVTYLPHKVNNTLDFIQELKQEDYKNIYPMVWNGDCYEKWKYIK